MVNFVFLHRDKNDNTTLNIMKILNMVRFAFVWHICGSINSLNPSVNNIVV